VQLQPDQGHVSFLLGPPANPSISIIIILARRLRATEVEVVPYDACGRGRAPPHRVFEMTTPRRFASPPR
jgi:hypothetical protein